MVRKKKKRDKKTGQDHYEKRHWKGLRYKDTKQKVKKSEYINEQSMFINGGK